jgi:hypothetical protein
MGEKKKEKKKKLLTNAKDFFVVKCLVDLFSPYPTLGILPFLCFSLFTQLFLWFVLWRCQSLDPAAQNDNTKRAGFSSSWSCFNRDSIPIFLDRLRQHENIRQDNMFRPQIEPRAPEYESKALPLH